LPADGSQCQSRHKPCGGGCRVLRFTRACPSSAVCGGPVTGAA
jgi:hypothetical protein